MKRRRHRLLGLHFSRVLLLCLVANTCAALNLEGFALLEFRAKVEDDPYGALKNWDRRDADPCDWSGVRCIDGKVEILNLTGLGLRGTLAPELGKLSHVKSLVLSKNEFRGVIPMEIGQLMCLELLDLSNNNLSGTIPEEIWEIPSLKHFFLCDNKFQVGVASNKMRNGDRNVGLPLGEATEFGCSNRKVGCRHLYLFPREVKCFLMYQQFTGPDEPHVMRNLQQNAEGSVRRELLQEARNLPALSGTNGSSLPPPKAVSVPSSGSGSFPAAPSSRNIPSLNSMSAALISIPQLPTIPSKPDDSKGNHFLFDEKLEKLGYLLVLPGIALLATIAGMLFMFRRQGQAAIGPWKTGLSGQLQKAFVTGVPKLNRSELEAACEDFSNIVSTFPKCTVFKGTLSNGVEIAVVSSVVASAKDWSKRAEGHFRKKIDTLSRINHKNFINLIGYCEENEPFMRMMVFEYAPNGTLFEHLHIKEFEHLDWGERMRIIMGTAYCLQYLHHELKPPVAISNLQSNTIFMTDDYAAKMADISIWNEIAAKQNVFGDYEADPSEVPTGDPECNIYSFGILLLEIISGKLPNSEEQGSLLNWATEYLNDKRNIKNLVDPTLKNYKDEELEIICEVIQECIHPDPRNRPTMREIASKLRLVLAISPEAAAPRLSPLWWAELEILSVEAS
ncbi:putative LRR receptor-like serine/threonine-protein kinase [Ananas comosus]|uniref:Putative LRR receptor-like serine/threonine-protein kinase n=1 Tax=Ananas comosus TaxID=4615 RepID=A0A199VAS2_ANACO|nr:putative LRR receptor-like serine/threonine-protein kinase [Ananas comosus]